MNFTFSVFRDGVCVFAGTVSDGLRWDSESFYSSLLGCGSTVPSP